MLITSHKAKDDKIFKRQTAHMPPTLTCLVVLTLVSCGLQQHAKKPHKMEGMFGHILFSESRGHFPQLAKAPKIQSKGLQIDNHSANKAVPDEAPPMVSTKTPGLNSMESADAGFDEVAPPALSADTAPTSTVPPPPKRPKAPLVTTSSPTQRADEPKASVRRSSGLAAEESRPSSSTKDNELLASAKRLIGLNTGFDSEKFLAHLLQTSDIELAAGAHGSLVKALYSRLETSGQTFSGTERPAAGDLIFFSNTYDRDQDERPDDWFTMAGIVERIDGDGTIQFIGFAQGKIQRLWMNLERPSAIRNESYAKVLNSQLRRKSLTDRPFTRYYAGELFASFGRL